MAEKLALKKLQENMGSITHQEKQEQHGSRRLKGLGGNYSVKHRNQNHHYVEGVCPKCGNPIRRKAPADLAFCLCSNPPVEVELFPVYYEKNMVITHRQVKIKITYGEDVPLCPSCHEPLEQVGKGWYRCRNEECPVHKMGHGRLRKFRLV